MIMRPEPSKFMFDSKKLPASFVFNTTTSSADKQKILEEERSSVNNNNNRVEIMAVDEFIEIVEPSTPTLVNPPKDINTKVVDNNNNNKIGNKSTRDTKLSTSSKGSDDEESTTTTGSDGKPNHSYISLIANAILASKDKRLVLSDIYQFVLDTQPYFRNKAGQGWRNSIRHNLSLNECFIKAGRSPNGKGHFWAINPANFDDFSKGDFRRRRAQRRARRAMAFGDLIEHFGPYWSSYQQHFAAAAAAGSGRPPIPPPPSSFVNQSTPSSYRYSPYAHHASINSRNTNNIISRGGECKSPPCLMSSSSKRMSMINKASLSSTTTLLKSPTSSMKRGFDVESLLRDDDDVEIERAAQIERPVPMKISKRPSSTEVLPPFVNTPSPASRHLQNPYMRLNLDYEKRFLTTSIPSSHRYASSDILPRPGQASSLYDRYRHLYPSTVSQRSHYLSRADEHFKLSMV